jgi:hypothetical protein
MAIDLEAARKLGAVVLEKKPADRTTLDPSKLHVTPMPVTGGAATAQAAATQARVKEGKILGWYKGVEAWGSTLQELAERLEYKPPA